MSARQTLLAFVLGYFACNTPILPTDAKPATTTTTTVPPGTPTVTAADLAFCVSDLNGYRARLSRSPLTRAADLEAYATVGASSDAKSNVPHQHINTTHNNTSNVRGENAILRQSFQFFGGTIQLAMHNMNDLNWQEGPLGGHFQNMMGAFTQVGCGVFLSGDDLTIVQDFR